VFVDEAGFYLLPGLVRTYAPRGQRPIVKAIQTYDHLSVASGLTMSGKLYTLIRDRALASTDMVAFLTHLQRQMGSRLLVIWDGSPIHRGTVVADFLSQSRSFSIHLEPLPPYAPDLNPDEGVWQHLKHVEMRNLSCSNLIHLRAELHLAIMRLRSKPHLLRSFFAGAQLPLKT
jgi:transposase